MFKHMPKLPGVYKWTNKLNGKIYIGKSVDLRGRCQKYLYKVNKMKTIRRENREFNMIFEKALVKYGFENFNVEVLECYPLRTRFIETHILRREEFWIKIYDATNKKIGYNILSGDRGLGHELSEEGKKRISIANMGENNGMFGKACARRMKICKVDTESFSTIEVYDSLSEAGQKNKINIPHISDSLKGKRIKVGGFYWDKLIEGESEDLRVERRRIYFEKRLIKKKQVHSQERRDRQSLMRKGVRQKGIKLTKVRQIDPTSGEIIGIYDAVIDAERHFNPTATKAIKISNHLRKLTKLAYGFKWEKISS